MKIGVCGGMFDPFHRGHLEPILAVRSDVQWDCVLYVPANVQPFKLDRDGASPFHRFAMTAAAILDHDALYVSERELERGRVSYTVDTLEELRAAHPDDTLDWIIGDDHLAKLLEWRAIDRIFELANFVVLARGKAPMPPSLAARLSAPQQRSAHGAIVLLENAMMPISSTDIRGRVRDGKPFEHLVPPSVAHYIHHYELYRKGPS